jgi:hypothetical protein
MPSCPQKIFSSTLLFHVFDVAEVFPLHCAVFTAIVVAVFAVKAGVGKRLSA